MSLDRFLRVSFVWFRGFTAKCLAGFWILERCAAATAVGVVVAAVTGVMVVAVAVLRGALAVVVAAAAVGVVLMWLVRVLRVRARWARSNRHACFVLGELTARVVSAAWQARG